MEAEGCSSRQAGSRHGEGDVRLGAGKVFEACGRAAVGARCSRVESSKHRLLGFLCGGKISRSYVVCPAGDKQLFVRSLKALCCSIKLSHGISCGEDVCHVVVLHKEECNSLQCGDG